MVVQMQRYSYGIFHGVFGSLRMPGLLRLFTLLLISLLLPGCGKSGLEQPLATIRLSERPMVLRSGHPLSPRLTAFVSDEGLTVFDTTGMPSQAAAFRRRIEQEFERKDFRFVVNTHDHWDHWCGNQVFTEAFVISHESCLAEMKRHLDADSHPAPNLKGTVDIWKKQLAGVDPKSENAADLRNLKLAWEEAAAASRAHDYGQKEKPIQEEFTLSRLDPVLIDFEAPEGGACGQWRSVPGTPPKILETKTWKIGALRRA